MGARTGGRRAELSQRIRASQERARDWASTHNGRTVLRLSILSFRILRSFIAASFGLRIVVRFCPTASMSMILLAGLHKLQESRVKEKGSRGRAGWTLDHVMARQHRHLPSLLLHSSSIEHGYHFFDQC
ncbi:hypothetical protein BDW62DRAFT_192642 [Aspergillus aurantiobrunneus]